VSRQICGLLSLLVLAVLTGCPVGSGPDPEPPEGPPPVTVATWNLHNFSDYGADEWRIPDLVEYVSALEFDVLAVQELLPDEDGSDAPSAFDLLMEQTGLEGVHNPFRSFDTSVGLVVNPATTSILSTELLFDDDTWAFPRPPMYARVAVVGPDGRTTEFGVVSLHLKAHGDDHERRRLACEALATWAEEQEPRDILLIGDLNDDPYDDPDEHNVFSGTLLGTEPDWRFLTSGLPPESVTSTGWYHVVDGVEITGEFIDHAVARGELMDRFTSSQASILGLPEQDFEAWRADYSDHFPVVIDLIP
jgi:endonuclease/exonuclease/phosphatase family metal-dependent hydrolase